MVNKASPLSTRESKPEKEPTSPARGDPISLSAPVHMPCSNRSKTNKVKPKNEYTLSANTGPTADLHNESDHDTSASKFPFPQLRGFMVHVPFP